MDSMEPDFILEREINLTFIDGAGVVRRLAIPAGASAKVFARMVNKSNSNDGPKFKDAKVWTEAIFTVAGPPVEHGSPSSDKVITVVRNEPKDVRFVRVNENVAPEECIVLRQRQVQPQTSSYSTSDCAKLLDAAGL
ncbi:hypothetical protein PV379_00835 [Streptomyces caniscabiei]|uniref:hypothetical protein n=1 Tax=Streptomyces caniscabiei TaxID=2746961 RepID=UPI0029AA0989|nr:hypothetical protein [Streptomyces caniscabiei]MDX2775900.1 hypothetical protein [Streptomyces caniscabiei]